VPVQLSLGVDATWHDPQMLPRGLCALLVAFFAWAAPAAAAVKVQRAVVYGHAKVNAPAPGSAALLMDVYRPAKTSRVRRPVVVLIHGGGFTIGSRTDARLVRIARALAARGIVALSIDYRLRGSDPEPSKRITPLLAGLPQGGGSRAIVTAVDDTLTSISYLRRHARALGIDPNRIGLVGASAGAITADHVAYVLDDYGIRKPRISFVGDLWGGILIAAPGGGGNAAVQLDHAEAPLFAVHGDADPTVPVQLDDELVARARAKHVRTEYHRIPGGTHGYPGTKFFTYRVVGKQTSFDRLLEFAKASLR
jgi:acetyl esterase/lipase